MNAFFIPQLGSIIYTMDGMMTQLHLSTDRPGSYLGLSSQYSGDGFSDMHFNVRAMSSDGFAASVDAARGTGQILIAQTYAALAQQSVKVTPVTYREVDRGLFQRIVSQALPAGPGPVDETNLGALQAGGELTCWAN